jgi:hypothetical protein
MQVVNWDFQLLDEIYAGFRNGNLDVGMKLKSELEIILRKIKEGNIVKMGEATLANEAEYQNWMQLKYPLIANILQKKESQSDNAEELKFLAEKSNELLVRQIESYRQTHGKSGTIIGVIALFIPFFLNGLDNAANWIQLSSILPVVVLCWAMLLLLMVLRSKKLKQGINIMKIPNYRDSDLKTILLKEITINRDSFEMNNAITAESNRRYNFAIILTIGAIITSAALLMTNKFIDPKSTGPIKVKIVTHE